MATYGVGIVGLGWVAGAHLENLRKLDSYEPVAIMSRRELDRAALKEQYGVDVKVYNDYEQFLADDNVDVVDICTPHFLHAEQTIAASEAKKDIILEKPIALTFDDCRRMLETVQKNGSRTSICFEVRFISSAQAIKSIVEQKLIGEVYYGEADYYHGIGPWLANQRWEVKKENGGSSLLRAGCHALDLLRWFIGEEVEEVFSYSNKNPSEIFEPYDYDLNSVHLLKFKNNCLGKVSSVTDCRQPYTFNMNVVGSEGSVKNDQFHSKKIEGLNGWASMDVDLIDSGEVEHHPYAEQFQHFAECLDKGVDPHNNLADAVETHRVIFAADESAETGKPVRVSDYKV